MSPSPVLEHGIEVEWEAMSDREQAALEGGQRTPTAAAGSAIRFTGELGPVHRATTLRTDGAGASLTGPRPCFDAPASIGELHLLEAVDDEEALDLAGHFGEAAAEHSVIAVRRVVGAQ